MNANANDECEWGGTGVVLPPRGILLCRVYACELISRLIKHFSFRPIATCSNFFYHHRSLHLYSDVSKCSCTNSVFCDFFFTFVIHICILHKWNLSFLIHQIEETWLIHGRINISIRALKLYLKICVANLNAWNWYLNQYSGAVWPASRIAKHPTLLWGNQKGRLQEFSEA